MISSVAAAAVVLFVSLTLIDALPVGVVHDDAMYAVLAKSLATGQGYHWLNLPGAPAATHFPPGYPALLSLVWRIMPAFPENVVAFKLLNAVLLACVAGVIAYVARRRLSLSPVAAAIVAIVGCLAIPMLVLSTIVMSETFFLALLVPALLYADRVASDDRVSMADAVALGAAGGALMLVRTHGVAFVAAVAMMLLLRRDVRVFAASVVAATIVVLPWQLWQANHSSAVPAPIRGDYGSYGLWLAAGAHGNPLAFASRTVAATSREVFAMFAGLSTAGIPTLALRWCAVLATLAMLALGLVRLWRAGRVTTLFAVVYLAIILLWPFTPARFLWGIWPLVVFIFVAGLLELRDWHPAAPALRGVRIVAACAVALALIGHAVYSVRGYRGQWWASIPRSTTAVAQPSLAWVALHTRPTDVVASNAELMVYLYTGRHAVPATRFAADDYFVLPSAESRADGLRAILQAYRVDAVAIVANDSLEVAARRIAGAFPSALQLRDSVPHGLIFTPTVR